MKQLTATGKTVEIAIENGLKELNLPIEKVNVEVLSEGGFLKSCKVRLAVKQSEGQIALEFIETLLEKMEFLFASEMTEDDEEVRINLIGTDGGCIIGYRGEVLDAMQHLASLVANRGKEKYKRITIDTEGYRQKRIETLEQLAKNLESKVKRINQAVKLEPMNPYERRIIHATLQESQFVSTSSEGNPPNRYVVISPKQNRPSDSKKSLNFAYRSK